MSDFAKLKDKYGVDPKMPVHLPDLRSYCVNCGVETGTKVLFMRQGLGNACEDCGQFRKGKRFLSKAEFAALTSIPARRNGAEEHYAKSIV